MPHPAYASQAADPFELFYTEASSSLTQQVVQPRPLAAVEPDDPTTEPTTNFTGVFSAAGWEPPSTSDLAELFSRTSDDDDDELHPFTTN